jgi:hypothetical protein
MLTVTTLHQETCSSRRSHWHAGLVAVSYQETAGAGQEQAKQRSRSHTQ